MKNAIKKSLLGIVLALPIICSSGALSQESQDSPEIRRPLISKGISKGREHLNNFLNEEIDREIQARVKHALESADVYQGHASSKPEVHYETRFGKIPLYYDSGKILRPELSDIEEKIEKYIDKDFIKKIEKLTLSDRYFSTKNSKFKSDVKIKKGKVEVSYDANLSLSSLGSIVRKPIKDKIGVFSVESKLYEMFEIAKFITDSHKKDPDMIAINKVLDMAKERDLYVKVISFNEDNINLVRISQEGKSHVSYGSFSSVDNKEKKDRKITIPRDFYFLERYSK